MTAELVPEWQVAPETEVAMSKKDDELTPADFPVHAEGENLKTTDGRKVATGETPAIADQIAGKLNEQAYRDEEDCWSA